MPAVLPDGVVPTSLPRYPHLLADDARIWTAWLARFPDVARRVWYDLHVGEPMGAQVDLEPRMRRVAAGVSRKRIDVVLRTATEYVVCEIKPWAHYTALGQAMLYWRLFKEEYNVVESCRPGIICGWVDPDIRPEIAQYGIRVWEVYAPPAGGNSG